MKARSPFGLLGGVKGSDIALALLATCLIEGLAFGSLGLQRGADVAGLPPPVHFHSIPVTLVTPPEEVRRVAKIKLGGGGGGSGAATPSPAAPVSPALGVQSSAGAGPEGPARAVGVVPSPGAKLPHLRPTRVPLQQTDVRPFEVPATPPPAGSTTGVRGTGDGPAGEGYPDGDPDGTITDPLEVHAIRLYRVRLQTWFGARFRAHGIGLSRAELDQLRVQAVVAIDAQRTVTGFTVHASGNAVFDRAVHRALEARRGMQLPPPPERYPGSVPSEIRLNFVCAVGKCD